ncbi:hypothetical protein K491DRAFT_135956 [Lophiostoma macrostomum CBS 122681]|uniref:Uncharacterized protein n=1 Tax=Lophiostoma macrostomum CBS 122681 TaxID=1314788 RepID=A0A6A6TLL2_9PLEO|nr:hypothetical protein K491DRAFT_135956 [Lophiostoma macrostomum CBS 122681]
MRCLCLAAPKRTPEKQHLHAGVRGLVVPPHQQDLPPQTISPPAALAATAIRSGRASPKSLQSGAASQTLRTLLLIIPSAHDRHLHTRIAVASTLDSKAPPPRVSSLQVISRSRRLSALLWVVIVCACPNTLCIVWRTSAKVSASWPSHNNIRGPGTLHESWGSQRQQWILRSESFRSEHPCWLSQDLQGQRQAKS